MVEKTSSRTDGRIPPQDIDAEKSLLGAILISDTVFPEVIEIVHPYDFYEQKHGQIFQAMISLYDHNKPIDLLTLTAELRTNKALKGVGGAPYITELTNFVPTSSHAKAYADIVKKMSVRRQLIKAGTTIAEKAFSEDAEVAKLIDQAEKDLFEVSKKDTKSESSSLDQLLVNAFDRIEMLYKNKGALRGLKTGYPDLDKNTAGLQKGDLFIVGARPSMGKTTLAHNIAYNVASINKAGVLFFSMEMSKDQIVDRIVSDVSGVGEWNIRTGNISDEDLPKISDALGEMSDIPLYIDDTSGMDILEIRNKARRAVHDNDIKLIIIDYLQLIQGSDRYAGNRVQEVTEISRGLKILARELEVTIIALAQLNRGVTGRDDPRPQMSDLRESGSIEQDADIIALMHSKDYFHRNDPDYEEDHIMELIIAKHRNGPVGTIKLYFDTAHSRFLSLDETHDG
ncbi:replicative DNA helicase [Candidatus Saccharibacteria bacterium]|nr:replicative DNA helicase [Candidatus Saccharibacteria bacterium]